MSILEVKNLSHGFGDRAIFEDVSFRLLKGEHIGLVGANGEGKSTFMSIVTGKMQPDEGKVEWSKYVTAGYLDQHAVLKEGQTALLVGGGIGVPPLYELAKQFKNEGIKTIHILGFNNEKDVFYEDKFSELGTTYVATADGTYGEKGFVTDVIKKYDIAYDKYFSCGPFAMLKALTTMDEEKIRLKTSSSLIFSVFMVKEDRESVE